MGTMSQVKETEMWTSGVRAMPGAVVMGGSDVLRRLKMEGCVSGRFLFDFFGRGRREEEKEKDSRICHARPQSIQHLLQPIPPLCAILIDKQARQRSRRIALRRLRARARVDDVDTLGAGAAEDLHAEEVVEGAHGELLHPVLCAASRGRYRGEAGLAHGFADGGPF